MKQNTFGHGFKKLFCLELMKDCPPLLVASKNEPNNQDFLQNGDACSLFLPGQYQSVEGCSLHCYAGTCSEKKKHHHCLFDLSTDLIVFELASLNVFSFVSGEQTFHCF